MQLSREEEVAEQQVSKDRVRATSTEQAETQSGPSSLWESVKKNLLFSENLVKAFAIFLVGCDL